jgi:hypothetical protein
VGCRVYRSERACCGVDQKVVNIAQVSRFGQQRTAYLMQDDEKSVTTAMAG